MYVVSSVKKTFGLCADACCGAKMSTSNNTEKQIRNLDRMLMDPGRTEDFLRDLRQQRAALVAKVPGRWLQEDGRAQGDLAAARFSGGWLRVQHRPARLSLGEGGARVRVRRERGRCTLGGYATHAPSREAQRRDAPLAAMRRSPRCAARRRRSRASGLDLRKRPRADMTPEEEEVVGPPPADPPEWDIALGVEATPSFAHVACKNDNHLSLAHSVLGYFTNKP